MERGLRHSPQRETLRLLADALDLSPSERDIFIATARSHRPPSSSTATASRTHLRNLPNPPTSLIGRQPQVAAIAAMLREEGLRLLTITGPGGVGKTRLAVAVANVVAADFPDGLAFVDFIPLANPALVPAAIAAALGIQDAATTSLLAALQTALHERQLLLVLDNCEHLLAAAPALASLLDACPNLTILATSRAPLHLRAERELLLAPLPLPPLAPLPDLAELGRVPAVAPFVDRANAARAEFALSTENGAAVAAICHRLDGLPLAIELAAARIKMLPEAALLARLEPRLPLLTGGPRDQHARHQTMGDAIAWSHDLLSPAERTLFRRLAVFTGGFTLDAAEWVMAAEVAPQPHPVWDGIATLVDWNLLQRQPGTANDARFTMLETIREYAWERLRASEEVDLASDAHAAYFLHLAAATERDWYGSEFAACMATWAPEAANLRAALGWLGQTGAVESALKLMANTGFFWLYVGPVSDGLDRFEHLLAASDPTPTETRTEAVEWAAILAGKRGDFARQLALAKDAVDLARLTGDALGLGLSLCELGRALREHGAADRTRPHFTEALAIFRQSGPVEMCAIPLLNLGLLAADEGDRETARALATEALELRLRAGNAAGAAIVRHALADLTHPWGERTTAAGFYRDNLEVYRSLNDLAGVADSIAGLAMTMATVDTSEWTIQLLAAAAAIRDQMGVAVHSGLQAAHDALIAELRATGGELDFMTAWAAGNAMTLEKAIACADVLESELASPS